jgi:hypothetical protein
MSIKQNGGVFGRNPTFNDVTIEGDLIINGEVFTGLDFQGSWNASTNSPALASSVGTNGEFYIVSVAGSTDLNGITNWGIGDWAIFNGTVWQRVEGGADGNFNNLTANSLTVDGDASVAGTIGVTADNGTITTGKDSASSRTHWSMNNPNGEVAKWDSNGTDLLHFITDEYKVYTAGNKAFEIDGSGDISFYENTGTTAKLFWDASLESLMLNASTRVGTEILTVNGTVTTGGGTASGPALAFRADLNTGMFRPASQALGFSTAGTERLRIDASGHAIIPEGVTLGTAAGVYSAANTLDDYEEGNWTPVQSTASAQTGTWSTLSGTYTKVGDLVTALMHISGTSMGFTSLTGYLKVTGLPFTSSSGPEGQGVWSSLSVSTGLSGSAYAHAGGSFLWMISPSNTNVTSTLTLIVSYKTA